MKLLNKETYNYHEYKWTNRKLSKGCTWYKLISRSGEDIAFCKADNDLDTVHFALKDLQAMGYDVNGFQCIDKKEAESMDLKFYVLWNIYGEAKKCVLYKFTDSTVSGTCNGETVTKKLDKTKRGFVYQLRKTKVNTDGDSLKRHLTHTMDPNGAFNTTCLFFSDI